MKTDKEKSKLTPLGFEIAANTHLEGTNMGQQLTRVKLETDDLGKIKQHVIKNIRTLLKVAMEMTPDELVRQKCGKMIEFLQDY